MHFPYTQSLGGERRQLAVGNAQDLPHGGQMGSQVLARLHRRSVECVGMVHGLSAVGADATSVLAQCHLPDDHREFFDVPAVELLRGANGCAPAVALCRRLDNFFDIDLLGNRSRVPAVTFGRAPFASGCRRLGG